MEPLDPETTDLQELARRYLPDRVPRVTWEDRLGPYLAGVVAVCLTMVFLFGGLPQGFVYLVVLAGLATATVASIEVAFSLGRRRQERIRGAATPGEVLHDIAAAFRSEIETYRRRTLGPESEWARARHPLAEAKDEANRSVAYWTERAEQGGNADLAHDQIALARSLEKKFGRAVAEIDHRAEALRTFFNRCDARLAALDVRNRDLEESERLTRLSERADATVGQARAALDSIGREFVQEAIQVGNALAGLQRLRLLDQAERLDLSQLEVVAERIAEVSEAERRDLDELEEQLRGPELG